MFGEEERCEGADGAAADNGDAPLRHRVVWGRGDSKSLRNTSIMSAGRGAFGLRVKKSISTTRPPHTHDAFRLITMPRKRAASTVPSTAPKAKASKTDDQKYETSVLQLSSIKILVAMEGGEPAAEFPVLSSENCVDVRFCLITSLYPTFLNPWLLRMVCSIPRITRFKQDFIGP